MVFGPSSRFQAVTSRTARAPTNVEAIANNYSHTYQRPAPGLDNAQDVPSHAEQRSGRDRGPPVASIPTTVQPRLPTAGLDDEEVWWVVIEGLRPGAYQGL